MLDKILQYLTYDPQNPMLFNSGVFLFVFTVFIFIYSWVYQNRVARTVYVILFSLYFYYKASGWYLVILLLTVFVDYYIGLRIYSAPKPLQKKLWLCLSIFTSVGLLCYFKYTNFFLSNIFALLDKEYSPLDIFLPIGISFYTFQTLSYILDIYWGRFKPVYTLLDYTFYMTYFPHLVAGPIVRAADFLPQIYHKIIIHKESIYYGLALVIRGLVKKAIIADYIAQYNDLVFNNPSGYSGFENLMAMYGYTLQIYCDFSGYSDMAIGLSQIMGFRLCENFRSPYLAQNITDFWRRWHISLSSWLRDYIYIPLGGNRKGELRQYFHLLATMLIGGFWHGASWKFVFWGGMHGLGLVVHKLWQKFNPLPSQNWVNFLAGVITFHFVALLWIFFRASDFQSAMFMLKQLFMNLDFAYTLPFWQARPLFVVLLLLGFILHFLPHSYKDWAVTLFVKAPLFFKAALLLVVLQLIIQLQGEGVQPFIYFQF
ncbi:MAG: MBOAT family protein [Bacteroidia bacterium]|nr:MBOAT family protein [Bacteroidia bacterium]MDW8157736.1 MBOAT family protein [Bacteroidia bacterium]